MFNWFDLMRQAQTSSGFEAVTRQFQLTNEQAQRAMTAFMPAFAMGLQHAMVSNDPGRILQSMMTGGYQNFLQAAGYPIPPQAQKESRKFLDQLFGSDEVSRRVAHQAADYAGISVDTMQQMLPLFAGLLAGGMSHWMSAQAQTLQGFAMPAQPGKDAQAPGNPWVEMWAGWMKAAGSGSQAAANPFEQMMAPFMPKPPAPEPEPEPSEPAPGWESMMQTSREMQKQYLESLQSIFQDAWGAKPKKS